MAECVRVLHPSGFDIHFAVADRLAAYKCEPLRPDNIAFCVLAVWNPIASKFAGFKPLTQMFGSTAEVLNYNVLSRIIASLANRIFDTPAIGYFDDFGFVVSASVCARALRLFEQFCDLLGLTVKAGKSKFCSSIVYLGVKGDFPSSLNNRSPQLSLPLGKIKKWTRLIDAVIISGRTSHSDLEKLAGKLGFAQLQVFNRFARCMMQPLYAKLPTRRFAPHLSSATIKALKWWKYALANSRGRAVDLHHDKIDIAVYTDASCGPNDSGSSSGSDESDSTKYLGMLGAVILICENHTEGFDGAFEVSFSWTTPYIVNKLFADTALIYALELLSVVLTLYEMRLTFQDKTILFLSIIMMLSAP